MLMFRDLGAKKVDPRWKYTRSIPFRLGRGCGTIGGTVDANGVVATPVGPTNLPGYGGVPGGTGLDITEGVAIVPASGIFAFPLAIT